MGMNAFAIASGAIAALVPLLFLLWLKERTRNSELRSRVERIADDEKRNQAFKRAMPDLIFVIDREGRFLDYSAGNPSLLRTVKGQIVGATIAEVLGAELAERFMIAIRDVLGNGGIREFRYELDVPAGLRTFECRIVAINGNSALYISRDVTLHLEREQEVLRSLREKEALLREIHHRVKNNLQVISSLISLQTEHFRDPADKLMIQESLLRIQSMSQLYELLFQSKSLSSVQLDQYLNRIIDNVCAEYPVVSARIAVNREIVSLPVNLETALPLGLIVNELVSNSLKYAFPGNRSGRLEISLACRDGDARLTVRDDGPGFPAGLTVDNADSLGFLLVRSQARQIGGLATLLPPPGAAVLVTFPEQGAANPLSSK